MENKLLQPFLQAGLIDIGDSDERLANIEQSIAELQKKFEDDHSILPTYTLVGLDPDVSADEQTVIETELIIAGHWKALRAKFSERPIAIIRAVILNALYNVGIKDAYAARIIYLTASNFFPYIKLGREEQIIKQIISDLGDLAEQNAVEEWSLGEEEATFKLGSLKVTDLKLGKVEINKPTLKSSLKDAVQRTPQGHNPYQHPEEWGEAFAQKASEGIGESFNNAFQTFNNSITPTAIEAPINKFFGEFKHSLNEVLKTSFDSIRSVERRSKLLWWKETLYSHSIKNSYRTLDVNIQPIVMASDLYDQLPEITPVSVDFLLRDTIVFLNSTSSKKLTFGDFLKEISKEENKLTLREYLKIGKTAGRMPITDFFALLVNDQVNSNMIKKHTGVDETETVSLMDISVIVLHDLLTSYLVSE